MSDYLPQSVVVIDSDLRVRYASSKLAREISPNGQDISGFTLKELKLPDEFKDIWMSKVQDVFDSGEKAEFEFDLELLETSAKKWSVFPEFAASEGLPDVITVSHSVTSGEVEPCTNYRSIFDKMPDAFAVQKIIYDERDLPVDVCYMDANETLIKMMKKKRGDIVGHRMSELMPAMAKDWATKCATVMETNESKVFEGYVDAFQKHVNTTVYTISSSCIACITEDMSDIVAVEHERRKLEEELLHTEKLDAISSLAGGIAHDFNNYLQGIIGQTELMRILCKQPELKAGLETIESSAQRANEITQQLLGFAKHGKVEEEEINLHELLRDIAFDFRSKLKPEIEFEYDFKAEHCIMLGDSKQLSQVMVNFLENALEAIRVDGSISLITENMQTDKMKHFERKQLKYQEHIVISIKDTGVGLSPDEKKHIFEPFYSTKSKRKSVGMSLAMAYGVVRNHDGIIEIETRLGEGAEFKVLLPVTQKRAGSTREVNKYDDIQLGSGNVLVVDDQEVSRDTLRAMLEHLGYTVTTASSGIEAIDYFNQAPNKIDLVLLDVNMPIINGQETFEHLKDIRPDVSVVMITGHAVSSMVSNAIESGVMCVLQKPFSLVPVSKVVKQAIK